MHRLFFIIGLQLIEQGVEPVENKGAQCQANEHGGEKV
jgi:hypothetical protein